MIKDIVILVLAMFISFMCGGAYGAILEEKRQKAKNK